MSLPLITIFFSEQRTDEYFVVRHQRIRHAKKEGEDGNAKTHTKKTQKRIIIVIRVSRITMVAENDGKKKKESKLKEKNK